MTLPAGDAPSLPPLLVPDWPAPANVGAAMSTRQGGVSQPPFSSLNLGISVGDDQAATSENRARFATALGLPPRWLHLVHGSRVLELVDGPSDGTAAVANPSHGDDRHNAHARLPPADAAWTRARGIACTVQAADCMPVLMTLRDGSAVAAAHAGWRGLAGGILANTVRAVCQGTGAAPADLLVWLGPCIGPAQFEVGADVLLAFGQAPDAAEPERFVSRPRPDGAARWLANLSLLAQDQLMMAGVPAGQISVDGRCTVTQASTFFSFRRDGRTGRMAAAIWRR